MSERVEMADQLKSRSKAESPDGRLPQKDWAAVGDLYEACLKNAEQLLDEADLLLSHAYHARALALALVAYEEIGKSQIVADYFNNMVSKKEFREAFVKHEIKSAYNARQFHITSMNPFKASIEYDRGKAKQYSQYRVASLYVGYTEDYQSQIPSEVVKPEDAITAIAACRKEIKDIRVMSTITERIGSESFTK
jgi:AbiV family abortive infection protein